MLIKKEFAVLCQGDYCLTTTGESLLNAKLPPGCGVFIFGLGISELCA